MPLDHSARARIARGWLTSSLDQPTYAAQHGISTRTLRDWVCRYGGGRRPQAQLRAAIVASIEQLQKVLAALDAEAAAGSAAAPEDGPEVEKYHPERRADSAGPTAPGASQVSPPAVPIPPSYAALDAARAAAARLPATARDNEAGGQHHRGPSAVDEATGIVDLEALRNRVAQHRAARVASGARSRNPFLDWEHE